MRRILLLLVAAAILALPAAATARLQVRHAPPGFLVVRNASTDLGVRGRPVATVAVRGFVIGHIKQEGAVRIYHLAGSVAAQVSGVDVQRRPVIYHSHGVSVPGTEFSGSDFRFRAVGGVADVWRVVVKGAGVSLYAGGELEQVSLHGSVAYPGTDGQYSFDGAPFASLPAGIVTRKLAHK
jgi:hypothetical protein